MIRQQIYDTCPARHIVLLKQGGLGKVSAFIRDSKVRFFWERRIFASRFKNVLIDVFTIDIFGNAESKFFTLALLSVLHDIRV